jgi:hypothetical protein
MSNKNRIFFEKGAAYRLSDKGLRVAVDSIADQSPCDCELDCCLQAIKLKDHKTGAVSYIWIYDGNVSAGTLAELKAVSTIIK